MKLRNQTLLLVEDDENDVIFMRRALAKAHISNPLQVLHNGQEAIDYLSGAGKYGDRLRYPLPGMVLLDLKLPNKNGHEVLDFVRSHPALSCLLIVVFTSSAEVCDIRRAYQLGARSYLVKPSLPHLYTELLRSLKSYWFEHNESVAPQSIEATA